MNTYVQFDRQLSAAMTAATIYVQMPSGFVSRMPVGFRIPKGWLSVWDRSLGATVAYPHTLHWYSAD